MAGGSSVGASSVGRFFGFGDGLFARDFRGLGGRLGGGGDSFGGRGLFFRGGFGGLLGFGLGLFGFGLLGLFLSLLGFLFRLLRGLCFLGGVAAVLAGLGAGLFEVHVLGGLNSRLRHVGTEPLAKRRLEPGRERRHVVLDVQPLGAALLEHRFARYAEFSCKFKNACCQGNLPAM